MAGSRKFRLDLLGRSDVTALTPRAAEITGLSLIDKFETDQIEQILYY